MCYQVFVAISLKGVYLKASFHICYHLKIRAKVVILHFNNKTTSFTCRRRPLGLLKHRQFPEILAPFSGNHKWIIDRPYLERTLCPDAINSVQKFIFLVYNVAYIRIMTVACKMFALQS